MIYLGPNDEIVPAGTEGAMPVYVSLRNGMLHACIRAQDQATFRGQARSVGLIIQTLDGDGNAVWRVHKNCDLTEERPNPDDPRSAPMPRIKLTPGEMDEDGNYTVQPTYGSRYHANFRLNPYATEAGAWKEWAKAWTLNGVEAEPNANENALEYAGIWLIDYDSISSPANGWGVI